MTQGTSRFPGHACGTLRLEDVDSEIVLFGWVARRRDHGGLIFLDLRDASGIVQVVVEPDTDAYAAADRARHEWVIKVAGRVTRRPEGTENPELATGSVEVRAEQIELLSEAKTPPFIPEDRLEVDEATRLRYRYIDLRRPRMQYNLRLRAKVTSAIRAAMEDLGFVEVETPALTRATPEGARDFLVPSRIEKGKFYALAQSPQLYKQLLMVSGFGRYYQIVRCFRDEDSRADRQHEFTQLDLEMSFAEEIDVMSTLERVVEAACEAVGWEKPSIPLPRLSWHEAMARFGTDKPDLRIPQELTDVSKAFRGTAFSTFSKVIDTGGSVLALRIPGRGLGASRSYLDDLVEQSKKLGAKGLVWAVAAEGSLKSPVSKYWSEQETKSLQELTAAKDGDLILIVAGEWLESSLVLGRMRAELLQPEPGSRGKWCWIVEFPLVELAEDKVSFNPLHHPFCAPHPEDVELLDGGAEAVSAALPDRPRARAFDLVLDGWELGSGSVRIHDRALQSKVFSLLGIAPEQAEERFGYLLEAFEFGPPPHAGFAIGLDRMVAVLTGEDSIREVIAFPKTQTGHEPMLGTPASVEKERLDELGLAIKAPARR